MMKGLIVGVTAALAMTIVLLAGTASQPVSANGGTLPLSEVSLDPDTADNDFLTAHTVTATVTDLVGVTQPGILVNFQVVAGPNLGATGTCSVNADCTTDAFGEVSWTYIDTAGLELCDTIVAAFTDAAGYVEQSNDATKCWVAPPNTAPTATCVESVNPHGAKIPPAGKTTLPGPKGGQNEDGFYQLTSTDDEDLTAPPLFVTNESGSHTFGPFPSGSVVKFTEDDEAVPTSKPMGGPNSAVTAHIILDSDPVVFAVDSFGASSAPIECLVPEPPK